MDSKERSRLIGLAMRIQPALIIGKGGVSENTYKQIDDLLTARELVKISVLKNCAFTAKELIAEIAQTLQAEPIQAIGNKIILYRYSDQCKIHV